MCILKMYITNLMELSPYWEANSDSANQEMFTLPLIELARKHIQEDAQNSTSVPLFM